MNTYMNFTIRFRWLIVILIFALTLFMGLQLKHLTFDGSYRIWFEKESDTLKEYDNFRAVFGNDDSILILFKDDHGILNTKALETIQRITRKLQKAPYVSKVNSLTNYQYIHSDTTIPDEILVNDFISDINILTPQKLQELERIIPNEDSILGRIISNDLKTTMIIGRLSPDAGNDTNASLMIKTYVEEIIESENNSGYVFHLAGGPILDRAFVSLGEHDVATFGPMALLITMILLWFVFKKLSSVFLSVSIIIFASIIVLGTQVVLGYKINNFTANIPIFIVAIGVADAMHLLWVYTLARREGMDNHSAIAHSIKLNILPMFLTALTTAVGFISLNISNITPVKTLGIATASATILALLLTLLFIPAFLAILNPNIAQKKSCDSDNKEDVFSKTYTRFIIAHNKKVLFGSMIFFALIALGLTYTRIDSNTVRYFKEDVPFRQTIDFIQANITGPMAYEIVVDSKTPDGIKSPAFMKTVEKFSHDFHKRYTNLRHISSLVDVIKKFNYVFNHSKTIPDNQELIAQYLLLYTLSLPQGMEINDEIDLKQQSLRITAQLNVVDTSMDLEMIHWAGEWWKNTPYSATVQGQTVMFANMEHDVANTLILSLLLSIATVTLILLLFFRNMRMIPFVIIPNVLPVLLILGTMGWIGIHVNIGIAISASIIIGIAVDDTIHFLIKYKDARGRNLNLEESLTYVMHYSGATIIFTTVILSCAFMIFAFSSFVPNIHFGVVTAIALLFAVAIDLVMLPAMISWYDHRDKSIL